MPALGGSKYGPWRGRLSASLKGPRREQAPVPSQRAMTSAIAIGIAIEIETRL